MNTSADATTFFNSHTTSPSVSDSEGKQYDFGDEIQNMLDIVRPLVEEKIGMQVDTLKALNYSFAMPLPMSLEEPGLSSSHFIKAQVDNEEIIHVRIFGDYATQKTQVNVLRNQSRDEEMKYF